ncbi:MAG: hypothetical protein KF715_04995 [Candidatus Didemnitutus sp.]|nr:hypothetical protein [Candidatus Didemnitutus sp.]
MFATLAPEKFDFVQIATQVGEPTTLQSSRVLAQRLYARGSHDAAQRTDLATPLATLREKSKSARTLTALNDATREFLVSALGESRTAACWKRRGSAASTATATTTPAPITPAAAPLAAPVASSAAPVTAPAKTQAAPPTISPNSPAGKLATYRALSGNERLDYLDRHQGDIFRATADEKTLQAILRRNGDNPGPDSPIGKFLHLRTLPVGDARADYFAKHQRAIEQGATDFATAQQIAKRNGQTLDF